MSVFASHFWLWSIVALLGGLMVYSLGALLGFAGFISPVKRIGQWLDSLSPMLRLSLVGVLIVLIAYPSVVHKLWADANASEIRRQFEALPLPPGARRGELVEQMGGLYDPTGADGAYVVGWFATSASPEDVHRYYRQTLPQLGWVEAAADERASRFRDHPEAGRQHYELVVAVAPDGSAEVPPSLRGEATAYAVRLGAVDPRVTTQVAWLIDCLVRLAPTFPSCEAMGWHPLESAGSLPGSRSPFGR